MENMWNTKKQLSSEDVYGKDSNLIDEKYIYYDDHTCILFNDNDSIQFYKLENPFTIDIPIHKWLKTIHREDGPAIEYYNGSKEWYINGKPHREDGPAKEYSNGSKEWYINGKLHREGGPARIYNTSSWNGSPTGKIEGWYIDGKHHRDDGPAQITYDVYNHVICEEWFLNSNRGISMDKPSVICYNEHGEIWREEWYDNGSRNCITGPAIIEYNHGKIENYKYFIHGERTSKLSFLWKKYLNKLK